MQAPARFFPVHGAAWTMQGRRSCTRQTAARTPTDIRLRTPGLPMRSTGVSRRPARTWRRRPPRLSATTNDRDDVDLDRRVRGHRDGIRNARRQHACVPDEDPLERLQDDREVERQREILEVVQIVMMFL